MMDEKSISKKFNFDPKSLNDLANGIFAFSMTLLIVNIGIPHVPVNDFAKLNEALLAMLPDVFRFVLSFSLLVFFWMIFQRQMKDVKYANSGIIYIGVLILLLVVFVPLSTQLYSEYDTSVAAMLVFNLNIFLIGVMFLLQWVFITKMRLHGEPLAESVVKVRYLRDTALIVISLLSLCVGFISPQWSSMAYLILPFCVIFITRKYN